MSPSRRSNRVWRPFGCLTAAAGGCGGPGGRRVFLGAFSGVPEVLLVNKSGKAEPAAVGRVKVERRPLLLVRAEGSGGGIHSVVLQNAETMRLGWGGGG